jgi:hypothetical protein
MLPNSRDTSMRGIANNMLRDFVRMLPGIRSLVADRDRLRGELTTWRAGQNYPPGHYYSPIPDKADVQGISQRSGNRDKDAVSGIELNWNQQEKLFTELAQYYKQLPFGATKDERGEHRYYFENGFYSWCDGIILYGLLRHLQPARIIEVGSGFSSCLTLDVNDLFLGGRLNCTFEQRVQEVDRDVFSQLQQNDILFIDSSHVGKAASDVNFLFFDVLPNLNPGVWIHIHDVFYPFEYPEEWISAGRSWNEAYMLRCLLMFSSGFEVCLWGDALCARRSDLVQSLMPLCLRNTGAGIWIRRTGDL